MKYNSIQSLTVLHSFQNLFFTVMGCLLFAGCASSDPQGEEDGITVVMEPTSIAAEEHPFFDNDPEFFRVVKKGTFSKKERAERTRKLDDGSKIFYDIGLSFYKVRSGDTISEIKEKLISYDEFSYLKNESSNKLLSFNIPEKRLQIGMWIPIPLQSTNRHVSDRQFREYAKIGIEESLKDELYGPHVEAMIEASSMEELTATMVALAKQESGGNPIGHFAYHRWEPHKRAFSFTAFHILMEKNGPGLTARKYLNLTEGQCNHPVNAVRLFLGYFVEKAKDMRKDPASLFPIDEHMVDLAVFYNGKYWESTNPHYVINVTKYYNEALE